MKKVLIEMSDQQYEELKKLANNSDIPKMLGRALNTESYLQECKRDNARIWIERPNGQTVEWRRA